jgi:hypothetical protein
LNIVRIERELAKKMAHKRSSTSTVQRRSRRTRAKKLNLRGTITATHQQQPTPNKTSRPQPTQHSISPAIPITIPREVRWQIFDQTITDPRTIVIHPDKVHRGVLENLASSCTQLAEEISAWLKKRPDLLKHSTFGVVDPAKTTFKLTWQSTVPPLRKQNSTNA